MSLTADELTLAVAAPMYVAAVGIWALCIDLRGKRLLRMLRERMDPGLWEEVGAPQSLQQALRDPKRRWQRFIRSGEYRQRLSRDLVELIEDYRRRGNRMLVAFGVAGLLLLVRFWPLLKPAAL